MDHFMHLKTITTFKCLVTFGTGKWLLSSVGPFMLLQSITVFKCLFTLSAAKWLISCVGPFMHNSQWVTFEICGKKENCN